MWNREATIKDEGQRPVASAVVTPAAAVNPIPSSTVQAPAKPVGPPAQEERRLVAWVGKSVLIRGDLISLEDMTIAGRVEGTIELRDHTLTIGPDANIQADIIAKTVSIQGKVTGSITASDTVNISETGSVEGDITSRRLGMADGAVLHGKVATGAGASD